MLRRLLTIAALAAALAAPLPADAGTLDPHYHEPAVGECRNLTSDQLGKQSDTTAPIDCGSRHTTKIVAVPQIPDGETWATMKANNWAKLGKLYETQCRPAWETLLGVNDRTQAMTAYGLAWFMPTVAERNAGARWFRCDVYVPAGSSALTPLKYDAAPLVPDPLTNFVRKCMKGKDFAYTSCNARHAWRAKGSFNLRKQKTYPTDKQIRRQALAKCPALVTTGTFAWAPPTKSRWKYGYRAMACFNKTKH